MNLLTILDGEDKSSPLKNCIRNHYRHIRKFAKRTETNCFRIYDHQIREYPLAIDFYDGRFCVHYFSYGEESPREDLMSDVSQALSSLFGATEEKIFSRMRFRRAKTEQYEKASSSREFFTVIEYGVKFRVNLSDYLDTGLFLDHRETRQIVASFCKGKRVLNLFAYTSAFSIHAAMKGAAFTKSVDLSNTYTAWGRANFDLNNLPSCNHEIVRADCLQFLDRERAKYDIIIIDPPTLSRSKKIDGMFDIQRDYALLIGKALKLLNENGILFFSTNARKFHFDTSLFPQHAIIEISDKTLPQDFHDQKIHRCWKISK
jgi:23S rRNA (guanine2069-N7)-methyltransferase